MSDPHHRVPGHIPVEELMDVVNNPEHITDLRDLVLDIINRHAPALVDIVAGSWVYHPYHGPVIICSINSPDGLVRVGIPDERVDFGLTMATLHSRSLQKTAPDVPARLTTFEHYRDAPIGTTVRHSTNNEDFVFFTKTSHTQWFSEKLNKTVSSSEMTLLITWNESLLRTAD